MPAFVGPMFDEVFESSKNVFMFLPLKLAFALPYGIEYIYHQLYLCSHLMSLLNLGRGNMNSEKNVICNLFYAEFRTIN